MSFANKFLNALNLINRMTKVLIKKLRLTNENIIGSLQALKTCQLLRY